MNYMGLVNAFNRILIRINPVTQVSMPLTLVGGSFTHGSTVAPAVILIRAQAVNAVRYHPYDTYGIYTNPNPPLTIWKSKGFPHAVQLTFMQHVVMAPKWKNVDQEFLDMHLFWPLPTKIMSLQSSKEFIRRGVNAEKLKSSQACS